MADKTQSGKSTGGNTPSTPDVQKYKVLKGCRFTTPHGHKDIVKGEEVDDGDRYIKSSLTVLLNAGYIKKI